MASEEYGGSMFTFKYIVFVKAHKVSGASMQKQNITMSRDYGQPPLSGVVRRLRRMLIFCLGGELAG